MASISRSGLCRAGMNTQVCAVTVAYNSPEELERLLASLTGQDLSLSGLVVVDNSDESYLAANTKIFDFYSKRYAFSRYLATEENVGSAGGFRRGMEIVHKNDFDWVWLLDQDGTISPGCLAELLKHSENGDILCPNIVDIDQPDLSVPMVCTKNFLGRCYPAIWGSTGSQICTFGTHATLISKKVLDMVGYYDDSFFFVGFEDIDYAHRALQAGLTTLQIMRAEARHPTLTLKKAEKAQNRAPRQRQQAKYVEKTLRNGKGVKVLNEREFRKNRPSKPAGLAIKILKLLPTSLGYIRDFPSQKTPCARTRSIAAFSRVYIESKRLKPWQFAVALVYSMSVGLRLKIAEQREVALKLTLRLYFTCLAHRLKDDWPYTSIEQLCHEIMQARQ
jgi:rhamnopyranosyl-N-acetylglucosaminyl-diphospho-decaprenol beta-1,3/1,4-galactofuranosyltransferase